MPDWLSSTAADPEKLTVMTLLARLVVALVCGLCVAVIYRLSHGRARAATTGLVTTLVLLAVLIALVSIVIGSSVARAFSLVGALSIVRFRTVVEDTRDTAFVIFTVVVGMAAGAGLFWVAPLGLLVVGLAAVLGLADDGCGPVGSWEVDGEGGHGAEAHGVGRSGAEALLRPAPHP
jgi:hypothetical protein